MGNFHVDMLHEYIDGELEGRERVELARHLGGNVHDRALVEAYQVLNEALVREYRDKLHEPVPARILRLIEDGEVEVLLKRAPVDAVADDGRAALAPLARQAAEAFELYTDAQGQPPAYEAERVAEFFGWFEQRFQVKLSVPELNEFGFTTERARLLPPAEGATGQVLYGDATGRRLAICFQVPDRPVSGDDVANPTCIQQDRLAICYWRHRGVDYALVATMNHGELTRLVHAMLR